MSICLFVIFFVWYKCLFSLVYSGGTVIAYKIGFFVFGGKMKPLNVAIVGATGLVGLEFISILEERKFPIDKLYPFASDNSLGQTVTYKNKEIDVIPLNEKEIEKHPVDLALFSAGAGVALDYAKHFAERGTIVVDNSSAFRMDDDVPLVVPEVNGAVLENNTSKIIANPNCSTIQLVPFLQIVEELFGIKKVVVSTYQSVSGAGKKGIEELRTQISDLFSFKEVKPEVFLQRIEFNLIPQIGPFYDDGYCEEEVKMINESRKILSMPALDIDVTTVRVPTFFSHAETVWMELKKECSINELHRRIKENPEMVLMDDIEQLLYPTLIDSSGRDEVFVGRLRKGREHKNTLSAWIVADNVRKGAAYNAIRIAETIFGEAND